MARLSRRGLLALGAGGAAAGVAGAAVLASASKTDVARAVLHRLVGPFKMRDEHLDAVIYAFERAGSVPSGLKGGLLQVAETAPGGVVALSKAPGAGRRYEELERGLLTAFMMTTNYLDKTRGQGSEVTFTGLQGACSSPFAILTQA